MLKPHSQKPFWSKKYRKNVWTGYAIFFFIFSTIVLLIALYYYYNRVAYQDWRRYYNFFLMLGFFYTFAAISMVFSALNIISNRKAKKKMIYLSDIKHKFFLEVEGMVNYYLKVNEGKLYTAETLVSKLEKYFKDEKKKNYYRNNIESMLNLMVQRGTIQQVLENGKIHYSF
ncbi:MAG: hypothetical protein ACFE9Q_00170 [Candidatus Hodarchaeota archaeon]